MSTNPVQPLPPAQFQAEAQAASQESYLHKVLVSLDVLSNVVGGGIPDETISSRMARWATENQGFREAFGLFACHALNMVEKDHGAIAEARDLARAQAVQKIEQETPTVQQEEKGQ